MKATNLITMIALIPLCLSCTQRSHLVEDDIQVLNQQAIGSNLWYDEAYELVNGIEHRITNPNLLRSVYEFYYPVVVVETPIYLGSVLEEKSILNGLLKPVGSSLEWKDSIRISFSFPAETYVIKPTLASLRETIVKATNGKNFSGKQSQRFMYRFKQIYSYKELNIAFGAKVAIGSFFQIEGKSDEVALSHNTAMYIDFGQTYFNVIMDFPEDGNIFKNEEVKRKFLGVNPVYINLINYGRKGIILVESDVDYSKLSLAVRAAFKAKVVDGELNLDVQHKEILSKANIVICIVGGFGDGQVATVRGFDAFEDYIINGGVYTNEVYGVPISFSGAYAKDNALFVSTVEL